VLARSSSILAVSKSGSASDSRRVDSHDSEVDRAMSFKLVASLRGQESLNTDVEESNIIRSRNLAAVSEDKLRREKPSA
jgi:hypothetical protein